MSVEAIKEQIQTADAHANANNADIQVEIMQSLVEKYFTRKRSTWNNLE